MRASFVGLCVAGLLVSRLACASGAHAHHSVAQPAAQASAASAQDASGIPPVPSVLVGNADAFNQAVAGVLPLSPDQIHALRRRAQDTMQAIHAGKPPVLTSPSISVSFAPGSPIPSVVVAPGYVTNVQFVGAGGDAWPIVSAIIGNGQWFSVQQPAATNKSAPTNVLTIGALTQSASTTLSVLLKGAPAPVSVLLETNADRCDATVTMRMQGHGPNYQPPMLHPEHQDVLVSQDPSVLSFLDGIPPSGAKALRVSDAGIQAWLFNDHVYVKTRMTVMSPPWSHVQASADGTHVYVFDTNANVILISDQGIPKQIEIHIDGN